MIKSSVLAVLLPLTVASLAAQPARQIPNTLSRSEAAMGYKMLFDGATLNGWRGLGYDTVPTAHWKVVDGAIMKMASGDVPKLPDGQPAHGGDLMSTESFLDFELAFDWKVAPATNSGVKYNVSEAMSMKTSNHAALGFEYQVLDDSLNDDNRIPSHRAGALYDLIPPNAAKVLAPVGQWNTARIVFRGNHGEHWLNGRKIVEYDLGTPAMDSAIARSKYHTVPGFADKRSGHIVLQDHGDAAWFRNIRIKELP